VHAICFEARVWTGGPPGGDPDVYVRLDRGCGCDAEMVDLASFAYDGPFPGEQTGRNGLLRVTDVQLVDGWATVRVCVTADPTWFPGGYFRGPVKLTVVVNGVGEAACAPIDCRTLEVGGTFPADWRPLWCGDVPDFFIVSLLPWACWPDKPCTDGCVRGVAWWRTVNAYGACDATKVPWPVAGGEDKLLCGKTWLRILSSSAKHDPWVALAQQWIVAQLNRASGACPPPSLDAALEEAAALLTRHCKGLCGLPEERARVVYGRLRSYNDGEAGPVACPGKVPCCPPPPPPPCDPKPKGNNGVGNGLDPQPPGNPPVNDGPGTAPGKPGNRGGRK